MAYMDKSCSQTMSLDLGGIVFECLASIGGIKRLFLIKHDDMNDMEDVSIEENHTILPAKLPVKEGKKFIEYGFAKNQASLTTTTVESNGMMNWEHTLTMQFNRMTGRKHVEIAALATSELTAIVEDYNGRTWFIPTDGFLTADYGATVAQTGDATDSLNGYTLTLTGRTGSLPYEVDRTGDNETEFEKLINQPA